MKPPPEFRAAVEALGALTAEDRTGLVVGVLLADLGSALVYARYKLTDEERAQLVGVFSPREVQERLEAISQALEAAPKPRPN